MKKKERNTPNTPMFTRLTPKRRNYSTEIEPRLRYTTPTAVLNAYAPCLLSGISAFPCHLPLCFIVYIAQLAVYSGTQKSSRPTQGLIYCSTPLPFVVPRPTGVEQTSRHTLRARKEKKRKGRKNQANLVNQLFLELTTAESIIGTSTNPTKHTATSE